MMAKFESKKWPKESKLSQKRGEINSKKVLNNLNDTPKGGLSLGAQISHRKLNYSSQMIG